MRKKIIAGNWKMYKTLTEAEDTITALIQLLKESPTQNSVYIAAPTVYLAGLHKLCVGSQIKIGAQNLSQHQEGAYTGEISGSMLKSIGCTFTLVGHSERRQFYNETNSIILEKLKAALKYDLQPIFCCGELVEERQKENHFNIIEQQLNESVFLLSEEDISKLVIAYEPVWAIGTGLTASPEQAQEMHTFIRTLLNKKYGATIAENCMILYGGSVKSSNANTLFSQADIDGGLVGGASLSAEEFIKIITAI